MRASLIYVIWRWPTVEGCCNKLCLCPNYLLHTVGCSIGGIDLAKYDLGEYSRELKVTGITVCISLLQPPEVLCLMACLG